MAAVDFKRGSLANLPAAITDGTFYVTTDERAIYVDVGNARVRIGDFQEFATLTDLQANTNPSTTALYYISELNCLAKWNGAKYVQINIDTGATEVEVVGTGNAVTSASYDPATRKLTLTADATYTTASDVDTQIAGKIGELKMGDNTYATVKEYVDKKTDGIATDTALEGLTGRVTSAEKKLDKLNGDKETEGSVAKTVGDAITALDLANTYDPKGAADAKDEAIADAKKAGDDAQAAVDVLVGDDANKSARTIANEELAKQLIPESAKESLDTLEELAAWIQAHPDDVTAINKAIADLTALVGTLPEGATATTVVAYIKEYADAAIKALKIGDYAKTAELIAAIARIDTLEGKAHEHENKGALDGITAEKIAAWDAAEQNAKDYADGLTMEWGSF